MRMTFSKRMKMFRIETSTNDLLAMKVRSNMKTVFDYEDYYSLSSYFKTLKTFKFLNNTNHFSN